MFTAEDRRRDQDDNKTSPRFLKSLKVIRNYTDELIQTAQVSRLLHVTKYCRKLQCSG